ncbi:transmembrane protein 198-like isoform X2 [Phyllopteryx taeniolatus]|nr:transmembrane protein 198-like isoform X2 [Phyllopteryx taeniolatus]
MVIFSSGFLFGSTSVLWLYHNEPPPQVHPGAETKAGIGLGAGALCGLASVLVSTLGLLLCGLQLGCLLSCGTLVIIGQFYSVAPVWVPLSVIMAAGIATAVLTLQWQKLFVIIYTSFFGATTVMLCVDYLVGAFMLLDQVYDMFCQASPLPLCWFNWVITGICPLFGLTGVLTQWKLTHTEAPHKNRKKRAKKHKYAEFRRRQQYRRRGPPPLKRYAGDVLAPSYLRSLQERQAGTCSSTSSDGAIARALVDFDFETGSTVSLTAASPACMV